MSAKRKQLLKDKEIEQELLNEDEKPGKTRSSPSIFDKDDQQCFSPITLADLGVETDENLYDNIIGDDDGTFYEKPKPNPDRKTQSRNRTGISLFCNETLNDPDGELKNSEDPDCIPCPKKRPYIIDVHAVDGWSKDSPKKSKMLNTKIPEREAKRARDQITSVEKKPGLELLQKSNCDKKKSLDCVDSDVTDDEPFGSDDSFQDPDWMPMAKKRMKILIGSDNEDENDFLSQTEESLTGEKSLSEEIPIQENIHIYLTKQSGELDLSKPGKISATEKQGQKQERSSEQRNVSAAKKLVQVKERLLEESEIPANHKQGQDQNRVSEERTILAAEKQGQEKEKLLEGGEILSTPKQGQDKERTADEREISAAEKQGQDKEDLLEDCGILSTQKQGQDKEELKQGQDNERMAKGKEISAAEKQGQEKEDLLEECEILATTNQRKDQKRMSEEREILAAEKQGQDKEELLEESEILATHNQGQDKERIAEEGDISAAEKQGQGNKELLGYNQGQGQERISEERENIIAEVQGSGMDRPDEEIEGTSAESRHNFTENRENRSQNLQVQESGDILLETAEQPMSSKEGFNSKLKANRQARLLGKPYLGFKKVDQKFQLCAEKPARILKRRCSHVNMSYKTKNTLLCGLITEEDRKIIHEMFWGLNTWTEKKGFIKATAIRRGIKRRRKTVRRSVKKQSGHDFYLNHFKVCKKMYLNTLSIGEDSLRRWTKADEDILTTNNNEDEIEASGSSGAPVHECSSLVKNVKTWLDILPKVPSHYCRASSKKLYVKSTFRSVLHMHLIYKKWSEENNLRVASRMTFKKVLEAENISIHHPRKDQCDTCCSFKQGNITQEDYDNHIQMKNEASDAKKEAKSIASDKVVVITVDVQSVLLAPKLQASAIYYKQKLQCHNFTVYDTASKTVTIYFWHEADGNVTANEFTSCLVDYIDTLPESTEDIIVISDECCHQNRNRILTSALSDLSQKKNVSIQQLYLEKGHTMMEVDSVHSTIEQYVKPPIYAPSDYLTRIRQARPQNPYKIKSLHFDFFLDYEALKSNFKSIRPGKKKGDPVVVDIRSLKYLKDGNVLYKLRHPDEWQELPQQRPIISRRNRNPGGVQTPKQLYSEPIKITESKFKHLQELKAVIDKDYHPFYDSLTYISGA